MNANDFFSQLSENNWRNEQRFYAEREFDAMIKALQEAREDIISESLEDIAEIENMKIEENTRLDYDGFRKWIGTCIRNNSKREL